jgi:hypothetical protein
MHGLMQRETASETLQVINTVASNLIVMKFSNTETPLNEVLLSVRPIPGIQILEKKDNLQNLIRHFLQSAIIYFSTTEKADTRKYGTLQQDRYQE